MTLQTEPMLMSDAIAAPMLAPPTSPAITSDSAAPAVEFAFAPQPGARRRLAYGDMIRILGTVAVVTGHVCDMELNRNPLSGNWWVLNCVDAACRWAVPAYVMLSGSLLLAPDRDEGPFVFYRKRLSRIGLPLVLWSAVFMWFGVEYTRWVPSWKDAFINLASGKPYMHMHFVFRLAALYALTPMLRVFLRHTSREMLWGTVGILTALSMADSIRNCLTRTELSGFINFAPFMAYYLGGYLLREVHLSTRGFVLALIGFIASIAMVALGTGALVAKFGFEYPPAPGTMLLDFLSPPRVLMAWCGWLVLTHLFRHPWPTSAKGQAWLQWLAAATLGLYLIHPLFREMLYLHGYSALAPWVELGIPYTPLKWTVHSNVWFGIPLTVVLIYVPSLLATAVLMRIPYVRRIVGV